MRFLELGFLRGIIKTLYSREIKQGREEEIKERLFEQKESSCTDSSCISNKKLYMC